MFKVNGNGRIAKMGELQTGKNSFINITVAVDRPYWKKTETEQADFYNLQLSGKTAEYANKNGAKGSNVVFTGAMVKNHYKDKNGVDREAVTIYPDEFQIIFGQKANGNGGAEQQAAPANNVPPADNNEGGFVIPGDDDDELPFN